MALHPTSFRGRPLADLLHALQVASGTDLPAAGSDVKLYGPNAPVDPLLATLGADETRLPSTHPDVDVPGVDLEEYLGGGGQGCVYAGRVRRTGKLVAVKVLHRVDAGWAVREALLAARLRHPNILRVLRAEPAGAFWVVIAELVRGREMATLNVGTARPVLGQLADALTLLARQSVVHRDVKPANILLRTDDGSPVLVDFGLALDLAAPVDADLGISGTPIFLPPEAWRDAAPTPAWDAYALGVTAALTLADPHVSEGDWATLRAAKLDGSFDARLRTALGALPDAALGGWASDLLAAEPATRTEALGRAAAWLAA